MGLQLSFSHQSPRHKQIKTFKGIKHNLTNTDIYTRGIDFDCPYLILLLQLRNKSTEKIEYM